MKCFYCIAVKVEILHSLRSFRMTGKMQVTRKIMIKAEILRFDQRDLPLEYLLLRQRLFAALRVTGLVEMLNLTYPIKNAFVSVKSFCSVWNG